MKVKKISDEKQSEINLIKRIHTVMWYRKQEMTSQRAQMSHMTVSRFISIYK